MIGTEEDPPYLDQITASASPPGIRRTTRTPGCSSAVGRQSLTLSPSVTDPAS